MRMRLIVSVTALALSFTGLATTSSLPAGAAAAPPVLFGLIDHWKPDIVQDESQLNIHSGIVGLFVKWDQTSIPNVSNWFDWVRGRGAAPMVALQPPAAATLSQIAQGDQDSHLKAWADAMAAWNHPILLRLFPEMNNKPHSYSPRTRGQTTLQFRQAWRHVFTLFRNRGASKVRFIWNPYRVTHGSTGLKGLWPGAKYVNWVALDIYNFADSTHAFAWPYQLTQPSVKAVRAVAPHKPLMIAELGCNQISRKPAWIDKSMNAMQSLGAKAVVAFNEGAEHNWRLDSSAATLSHAKTTLHASNVTWAGRQGYDMARIDQLVTTGK